VADGWSASGSDLGPGEVALPRTGIVVYGRARRVRSRTRASNQVGASGRAGACGEVLARRAGCPVVPSRGRMPSRARGQPARDAVARGDGRPPPVRRPRWAPAGGHLPGREAQPGGLCTAARPEHVPGRGGLSAEPEQHAGIPPGGQLPAVPSVDILRIRVRGGGPRTRHEPGSAGRTTLHHQFRSGL